LNPIHGFPRVSIRGPLFSIEPESIDGRKLIECDDDGGENEPVYIEIPGEDPNETGDPGQSKDDGGDEICAGTSFRFGHLHSFSAKRSYKSSNLGLNPVGGVSLRSLPLVGLVTIIIGAELSIKVFRRNTPPRMLRRKS
jgi:hypothetical protein